jgi:hypothetical protein
VGVRVVLLVEDDTMGKHLHPYIESRTLRVNMYVHSGLINKEIGFHTSKNLTGLSALGSILKNFLGTDVGWCEGRTLGRGRHNG